MENQRIGHILMQEGFINDKALDFCLSVQRNNGHERLGKVLKDYDFISDDQMVMALAKQVGWEVYRGDYEPAEDMINVLGVDFMTKHMIFPAKVSAGAVFIMAFSDDMAATDVIQSKLTDKARFMLAPEGLLRQAIDKVNTEYRSKEKGRVYAGEDLPFWFERCLNTAITRGATDIHIEPSAKAVEVRFRIDGILHFYQALRLDLQKRLVNIIFHRAEVTISDFGSLHDARFSYVQDAVHVDVRVSHIPCVNGSSLVLRLLDKNRASISLTALGYPREIWTSIETMLVKPEGMVLITGPTGCGKTTTLYAMLNALKSIERKIVTIEDPVEIHHALLTQVQANEKRDINFSNAVRAFLRHDPNIMLIGEIRDAFTAQEAIRASMTGHKVFATLHANQGMDAFLRLHDLGVPYPYMASNISMVITQRLIRLLCPLCKRSRSVESGDLPDHSIKYVQGLKDFWEPEGCTECHGGYKGRTVIASILECDDTVGSLLLDGDIAALKDYIKAQGVANSMAIQVRRMIQEGKTSPQEAVRVLG